MFAPPQAADDRARLVKGKSAPEHEGWWLLSPARIALGLVVALLVGAGIGVGIGAAAWSDHDSAEATPEPHHPSQHSSQHSSPAAPAPPALLPLSALPHGSLPLSVLPLPDSYHPLTGVVGRRFVSQDCSSAMDVVNDSYVTMRKYDTTAKRLIELTYQQVEWNTLDGQLNASYTKAYDGPQAKTPPWLLNVPWTPYTAEYPMLRCAGETKTFHFTRNHTFELDTYATAKAYQDANPLVPVGPTSGTGRMRYSKKYHGCTTSNLDETEGVILGDMSISNDWGFYWGLHKYFKEYANAEGSWAGTSYAELVTTVGDLMPISIKPESGKDTYTFEYTLADSYNTTGANPPPHFDHSCAIDPNDASCKNICPGYSTVMEHPTPITPALRERISHLDAAEATNATRESDKAHLELLVQNHHFNVHVTSKYNPTWVSDDGHAFQKAMSYTLVYNTTHASRDTTMFLMLRRCTDMFFNRSLSGLGCLEIEPEPYTQYTTLTDSQWNILLDKHIKWSNRTTLKTKNGDDNTPAVHYARKMGWMRNYSRYVTWIEDNSDFAGNWTWAAPLIVQAFDSVAYLRNGDTFIAIRSRYFCNACPAWLWYGSAKIEVFRLKTTENHFDADSGYFEQMTLVTSATYSQQVSKISKLPAYDASYEAFLLNLDIDRRTPSPFMTDRTTYDPHNPLAYLS